MLANFDISTIQQQQVTSSQKKKDRYRGKKKPTDSKHKKPQQIPQDIVKEVKAEAET